MGEPPQLDEPKEHTEIGRFDMERAARMSGARFGYWIGDTALLALALYRFALDRLAAKGFVTVLPPVLVREEAMYGTGFFPSDADERLRAPGRRASISPAPPRSRSPSLHTGEILDADELPLRYVAFSPCFRREAGAAGKDTRGMFRVHQFNKVEQFSSDAAGELVGRARAAAREHRGARAGARPAVPRRQRSPAGDIRRPSAKTYDIEIWFPQPGALPRDRVDLEHDRLPGAPARDPLPRRQGPEPVHTLNGTAVVDRMALAILENFQGEVPDVLREYGAPERVTP